ncbi:hypothetical protein KY363_02705, partial [Candidatus Woesearchaeota archaeon]|nr:hypothetical protein [Candidatus Woesearchaeota archaeon]
NSTARLGFRSSYRAAGLAHSLNSGMYDIVFASARTAESLLVLDRHKVIDPFVDGAVLMRALDDDMTRRHGCEEKIFQSIHRCYKEGLVDVGAVDKMVRSYRAFHGVYREYLFEARKLFSRVGKGFAPYEGLFNDSFNEFELEVDRQ